MKNFRIENYLSDLAQIVNIDSGHHYAEGTNAVADIMAEKYRALGLKVEKKYCDGFEAAPFLTVRNSDSERIDVMMLAHMDTVFPVGTAAERPFSIDEKGHGRGPGVVDCKGSCMSMYYLIKGMLENNEVNFNFCLCMNSDEETKSTYSRGFIEEIAAKSDRCLVFEPGRPNEEFVGQRKSGVNYIVRCHGIAAHSGVEPEKGASAILELSKWIPELYKHFNLEEGTTVNIGRFDGGADNGQVPDYAEFTISLRCLSPDSEKAFEKRLYELRDRPYDPRCRVEVEDLGHRPAMFLHEKSRELLNVFEEVGREMNYPVVALTTGGGSDGNFVAYHNVATMDGCGPAGGCLHTPDEWMHIETVETRIDFIRNVLLKIFG